LNPLINSLKHKQRKIQMEHQYAPLPTPAASSGLATASLICGIGSVFFGPIAGIPAIITGHLALGKIKKSGGVLQGRGLAITGLILGYVLSVLSVIVISLAYAGVQNAVRRAQIVIAGSAIMQMEFGVQNFYDEYGSLPSQGTSDTTLTSDKDTEIFDALLGLKTSLNPKSIKFVTMKEGKDMKSGVIYDSSGTRVIGVFDPWGGAYKVRLDLDYDEQIEVNGEILKGRRVAVWSDGPDQMAGTDDDIKSWK
jgi:hypothetical protein